jgi:hypothetical protein
VSLADVLAEFPEEVRSYALEVADYCRTAFWDQGSVTDRENSVQEWLSRALRLRFV